MNVTREMNMRTDINLVSVSEASVMLRRSLSWMYRELQKGELPYVRVGGGIRIRTQDIEEYVRRRLVGSCEYLGGDS